MAFAQLRQRQGWERPLPSKGRPARMIRQVAALSGYFVANIKYPCEQLVVVSCSYRGKEVEV